MPRSRRAHEAVDARKRPVQNRSRVSVEAILEAAAQVLDRDGYTATTTDAVAERAGVSIGTLYQYFPNKDALLVALTERHALAARAAFEPLLREVLDATPPLSDWLQRFVRACVELNGRQPQLHQILFEETPFPRQQLEGMYQSGDLILQVLERFFARVSDVTVPNPRLAAYLVLRAVGSVIHAGAVRRPSDVTMADCGEELIVLLSRYLTAPRT